MPVVLMWHFILALLALWPAMRLLQRAGLARGWAAVLLLPIVGWPVFATWLVFTPWPNVPKPPPRMHTRERLRRARAARTGG